MHDPRHPALALLASQQQAWNTGDLDGYVARCAPDVVYVTARGLVVGREALGEALSAAYPDREAMGRLSLEVLHLDGDAEQARVVVGWAVAREGAPASGLALVVLARRDGCWWLTHDATLS
jgi:uncharacterized protein (TIGR02246 family)